MRIIGTIIKAVLVAYLVIFAVINMQSVQLTLFFGMLPFNMPMFLFTILVVFIGFILGVLMMMKEKLSALSQIKQLKKQLAEAGNEITRLKNLPLTESKEETASGTQKPDVSESGTTDHGSAIRDVLR